MSKEGLEKTVDFITAISEDREFNKEIIGQFDKYTVYVISNDGPYYYLEYLAESEWDDVLYRFNLLNKEYNGLGEFEEWDELNSFLSDHWTEIIAKWNKLNSDMPIPEDTKRIEY